MNEEAYEQFPNSFREHTIGPIKNIVDVVIKARIKASKLILKLLLRFSIS